MALFAMWQDLTNNPNRVIDTAKVEAGWLAQKPRADDATNFEVFEATTMTSGSIQTIQIELQLTSK